MMPAALTAKGDEMREVDRLGMILQFGSRPGCELALIEWFLFYLVAQGKEVSVSNSTSPLMACYLG